MAQFYQKINTLWKRDEKNRIIQGDYSLQEFGYLQDCLWLVEEKIDGTNMSYDIYFGSDGSINRTEIHGKTENAKIPVCLFLPSPNLWWMFHIFPSISLP